MLYADAPQIDWGQVSIILGTLITFLSGAGAAVLKHLSNRTVAQHEHEEKMAQLGRDHEADMAERLGAVVDRFDTAVRDLAREGREESKKNMDTLLTIHSKAMEMVSVFGLKLDALGAKLDGLATRLKV